MAVSITIDTAKVATIMGTSATEDVNMVEQAALAKLVIDENFEDVYSDGMLEKIGEWFTAHLISMSSHRELSTQKSSRGDSAGFSGAEKGFGLSETKYGRTVMMLDSKGFLKSLDMGSNNDGYRMLVV